VLSERLLVDFGKDERAFLRESIFGVCENESSEKRRRKIIRTSPLTPLLTRRGEFVKSEKMCLKKFFIDIF
jgi:hypothetical protein